MSLIVEVDQGKLKGKENTSVLTGKSYYSFQGIPYAKPPLGELRFQAPIPYEKWEGIYDATFEREICFQISFTTPPQNPGGEDCLYLNVNTPQIPAEIKILKPVMVFIHGGAYINGSGTEKMYSSDYLISHDVIVVTLNYRLHVFGFLNLGMSKCPGNIGLRDQLLALRWVKNNIAHFGGDPENITIFGESSGAVSVHYHTISPLSKGLFKRAIMQSGSVLSSWGLTRTPYEIALQFGRKLGFKGDDKEKLLEFLKLQDAIDLTRKVQELQGQVIKPNSSIKFTFFPSVETIQEGAFLPNLPEKLLKTSDPLPIIFGANNREGMFMFLNLEFRDNYLDLLRKDFSILFKNNGFTIKPGSDIHALAQEIKKLYFGDKEISLENWDEISNLHSDIFFYNFYESIENVVKSSCPAYVYEFNYDGNLNILRNLIESKLHRSLKGACHGDDLGYIFHQKKKSQVPPIEGDDRKVVNNFTKLWTNFAKYGDPSDEFGWKPSTSTEPSYLLINAEPKVVKGTVYGERYQAFKKLLGPHLKPYN